MKNLMRLKVLKLYGINILMLKIEKEYNAANRN